MTTRIGILGLGAIGQTHAGALAQVDGVEVVAASGGGDQPVDGWPNADKVTPDELFARTDIDVLAITTPSDLHGEHAVRALEAGMHVVIEKPIATSTADATKVLETAKATGKRIFPIAQRVLEPQHIAIKKLLEQGKLGKLLLVEGIVHWYRDAAYYAADAWRTQMPAGGSLMNQGLHSLSVMLEFLGSIESVSGHMTTLGHQGPAEDTCALTMKAHNGALGVVITSTATVPGDNALLTIRTDKGAIEVSHTDIVRWDIEGVPQPETSSEITAGSSDPKAIGLLGHIDSWKDILDALATGREASVTDVDGWRTVAVIDGGYVAAEQGRTVTIPDEPR